MSRTYHKKVCLNCGTEFETLNKYQKFCSISCGSQHTNAPKKKYYICQHCGKSFWKDSAYRMKYCSVECSRQAYREAHPPKPPKEKQLFKKECAWCGEVFETIYPQKIYCSNDCCYNSNLKKQREQWAEEYIPRRVVCKECGTEFYTECGDTHSVFCCKSCADRYERKVEHNTKRHKDYMRNIYAHGEGKSDNAAHEIISQQTITIAVVNDNPAELIADWNDHKFALAAGEASHIEGSNCLALGKNAHAEGNGTIAEKSSAHAEGTGSHAKGKYSHAGGLETTASGNESFAHGYRVRATGNGSVALGYNSDDFTDNNASEFSAIAIGHDTKASAYCSAAIGDHANALNDNAIAIENGVRTAGNSQTVLGKYNKEDGGKLLIV